MLLTELSPGGEADRILLIGAGAVGLTMAMALVRAGKNVLVIESGDAALHTDYARHNSVLQTGARFHIGATMGRYRGLGGTTRLWGGQLMPFTATDLLPNPAHGKPGWPITAEDLSPHVDSVLRLLGAGNCWADIEAQWERMAQTGAQLGPDLTFAPSLWLQQPDFAALWKRQLHDPVSAPAVLLDHEAVGLLADPAGGRITGVRLRRRDGTLTEAQGVAVVIACGTLETARLLLRAKAALPQSGLGGNAHVGRWFFDHLHGIAGEVHPDRREEFGRLFDASYAAGRKLLPKVRLTDAVALAEGLPNCAGVFNGRLSPGLAAREMRTLAGRLIGGGWGGRLHTLGATLKTAKIILPLAWRYVRSRRSANFLGGSASFGFELEQQPTPGSYLALEAGIPAQDARLVVNWAVDGNEMVALRRLALALQAHCAAHGLGRLDLDQRVIEGDSSFLVEASDSSHQMGGARMAVSADAGVVDRHGEVFGMPGLYVAGAPTFASGSFANPTLVAMALGQRLVRRLIGPESVAA